MNRKDKKFGETLTWTLGNSELANFPSESLNL